MIEATEAAVRREAVVAVAARLLQEHGAAAVTTRRVAEAAGVQAPTLYRLFGDKEGLLEAVAEHVLATYVAAKASVVADAERGDLDPVEDLRAGWRTQIDFGLANPALFALLSDPARASRSSAAQGGRRVLAARVHRIAEAGRLRVPEAHAAELIHAAGIGAVVALLEAPPEERSAALADDLLEAVLARVLTDAPPPAHSPAAAAAIALRAQADGLDALSSGERVLLAEWLDRVAAT